jgi:hypothetical protein
MFDNTNFTFEFSDFGLGYRNRAGLAVLSTTPRGVQTIAGVHKFITSESLQLPTITYRALLGQASPQDIADTKKLSFPIVCIRGLFSKRCNNGLIKLSPFVPIDVDDHLSPEESRRIQRILIEDPMLNVALSFVSPSYGAKIIIEVPEWASELDPRFWYGMIADHIGMAHGIAVDRSGKDLARATMLCWDPQAYINPKFIH